MFASLKNKIREETGNDISKLTAKITNSTVQKIDALRGKSGSSSSVNSIVSQEGFREDSSTDSHKIDDEVKKKLLKIEAEFARKLDDKEKEWREIVNDKDKHIQNLEKDRAELCKQVSNLEERLKNVEGEFEELVSVW